MTNKKTSAKVASKSLSDDGAADSDEALSTMYVTFMMAKEVYAVEMTPVKEIIRVPKAVRVPMAPRALEGVANLRGQVLPIISLRELFGLEPREHDDATRAVVIDQGQPLGFIVDRVTSVITAEPNDLDDVEGIQAAVNTDLLSGVLKNTGGHAMIMVIDFAKLIAREFPSVNKLIGKASAQSIALSVGDDATDGGETEDEIQLVSFDVQGQEYAVAIEDVREIVQYPEQIIELPKAAHHVLGMISLRSRLLPLVSLRRMFGLPDPQSMETCRIVVVGIGSASVGLVMDSVNEVLRVNRSAIDDLPALLAADASLGDIEKICRLDQGKRLVSVLAVKRMFNSELIQDAVSSVEAYTQQASNPGDDTMDEFDDKELFDEEASHEDQCVVYRLDGEEYGVPIACVQEIVRVPEQLTKVPKAPGFVEGVINLRGMVLPVLDQRRRFGLATQERNERQRIIVFLVRKVLTGFIVDSVAEVLKISHADIEAAPKMSGDQAELISRIANLSRDHRMIQLINPDSLVSADDVTAMAAVG